MHEYRTLQNGIRVVAEKIPYLHSISIGVWVGNGSRHELLNEHGISHFIEHMVFKGTHKRSAENIASEIDAIGGQINAFTAREYTCFYTKTLDEHAQIALDILSDIIFNPKLSDEDMELERQVISEEISLYEDTPEELVYDLLYDTVWHGTSMGRTILGTSESLNKIDHNIMLSYLKTHYTSANTVISVSGNYDEALFELLEKYFGSKNLLATKPKMPYAQYSPGNIIKTKDIEQIQLAIGFNGIDVDDEENVYSLLVFNNVFGCGMSSRLFQNIREKRGLVYSIGAGHSAYTGTGIFDISAGTGPANLDSVCELIAEEVNNIKRDKLSKNEVDRAKEQLKGSYILSYESTGARMQGAGRSLLMGKRIYTQEETIKKIESVTVNSVADIIDKVLDTSTVSSAAVGPINSIKKLF